MGFNLDEYEPVADRLERFWNDHPHGSVLTDLVFHDEKRFIVKVTVWDDRPLTGETWNDSRPSATGYAEELVGATPVNKTSALENCETSAIGRALANLGYAPKGQRPSREEMVKVASRGDTETMIDEARNATDREQACPACGSKVYDNRDTNRQRLTEGKKPLPAFKCANRKCAGVPGGDVPWISWEASYFDDGEVTVERGNGHVPEPVARVDYGPDEAPF